MTVGDLIKILEMLPTSMDIFVQTVPADYCSPLQTRNLSISGATFDEVHGLAQARITITAHLPAGE